MDKILIVDDQKDSRDSLREILGRDYCIVEAASGEEAVELISSDYESISAVILDLVMPGMDGYDVLGKIRNDMELVDIPIIIQTESTEEVFEVNALKMGASDFVHKPYNAELIRERLRKTIETKRTLNQIKRLASDEPTGMLTLNMFYYESQRWMSEYPDSEFDVVAEDIEHFELEEEADGAAYIIKAMSERVHKVMSQVKFLCARVYGDRFVFLFMRRPGYLDRLIKHTNELIKKDSASMAIHCKFGIYEITDKSMNIAQICGRAFAALNTIKEQYGNRTVYYDDELHNKIVREDMINSEMVSALETEQFCVYLQPKYDVNRNIIVGAEALVRWIHPVEGMISPGEFIPIFEKNGFISELDRYMWDRAAGIIEKICRTDGSCVPISVNVSRKDIENMDIVEELCQIVNRHNIRPEYIHLEITETAYMEDTEKILSVIEDLRNHGFRIELDDFGSGYSSLNMLASLPIDVIKLDMKIIQSLDRRNNSNASSIIEYTIKLANWMNIPIVAEGIETQEQMEALQHYGYSYVQGFLFSKPIPEDIFLNMLDNSRKREADSGNKTEHRERYFGKTMNMLLVEDLQLNRTILHNYFDDLFNIDEADNGQKALDILKENKNYDIILLDMYMPEMDGFQVIRSMRSSRDYDGIPILAMSSKVPHKEVEQVYSAGADAFIAKPFSAAEITQKVVDLLRCYNKLDNMEIWNLNSLISNPWVEDMWDKVYIINCENRKLCKIVGERIVDTDRLYTDIAQKEVVTLCYIATNSNDQELLTYKKHLIKNRRIVIDNNSYMVCFVKDISRAVDTVKYSK